MEPRFSAHARQRMEERLIDEAEVVEILAGPADTAVTEDRPMVNHRHYLCRPGPSGCGR